MLLSNQNKYVAIDLRIASVGVGRKAMKQISSRILLFG